MKTLAYFISVIFITIIALSCKQEAPKMSDDEVWRLGWRIFSNTKDNNYKLASTQFDSLRRETSAMDIRILSAGIESKMKLNKDQELKEILESQDKETLNRICTKTSFQSLELCEGFNQEEVEDSDLQMEIIAMYINDQYVRSNLMQNILDKYELTKEKVITDTFGYDTEERNQKRLKSIIENHGFPTRKLVGSDAMKGIFFIIQHSDHDKTWQKSQLPNIENAVKRGDMDGQSYAYLFDRIKINSGEKQRFGTQFSKVDPKQGIATLADTEDPENLDFRRRNIGLMPISMYKDLMLSYAGNTK